MFLKSIKDYFKEIHPARIEARELLKYIGPGILVTVGFIDPGNWASNIAAGSEFGYTLLWIVTLSTIMLILLQHNVAHLGIATGLCLSEATTKFIPDKASKFILSTAILASIATALAEILGAAIALNMLFHLPIKIGALLTAFLAMFMLWTNSYRRLEKWIVGFVSIIGFSFIYELTIVKINWADAVIGWIMPQFPENSIPIIMSVLGAVVMPHNLFLHSEIIQSRQWNLEEEHVIKKQLNYEFLDTLFSMIIGWGINSAMILVAASTFFAHKIQVSELEQAQQMLQPLLGSGAAFVFAIALLFSGIASSTTAGMAGGSIFSGLFTEPYDISDRHTQTGVIITFLVAAIIILFITDPFKGLIISQIVLSVQLPITIFTQIYLTSSKKVMGKYANSKVLNIILLIIAAIVTILNVLLFINLFKDGF